MNAAVTVAIPTLDAGPDFRHTLAAVRAQRLDRGLQVLVCDSGSSDDTVAVARAYGAEVIEIARESFSHGGTRNLLMSRARGDHVAFLTQDAVPAGGDWLARLLGAWALAPDAGLAFGPYRPRPDASVSVARELTAWFACFAVDEPRVDRLSAAERDAPPARFLGPLGFFTDANGCVERAAWERVPFRRVDYAEDHLLAQDMLRAGFAKVYVPAAAVIHSHEYSPGEWVRRSFDEARAIREVYGWSLRPASAVRNVRGGVTADWRWARGAGARGPAGASGSAAGAPGLPLRAAIAVVAGSVRHHSAVAAGELLGGRADRLPPPVVRRLSLEGRP
ncbi:MAG: glycosyltransferase family 2 protein [Solirubrobacteraceae bacterium]